MRFHVKHETRYRYSAPVAFAPHVLRLNPRLDGVRMVSRELIVQPEPVERIEVVDPFGNRVTRVTFDGLSSELSIDSRFELDTIGPFQARPDEQSVPPLPWQAPVAAELEPYRGHGHDESVLAFAEDIATTARWSADDFLVGLCATLHTTTERHIRLEGAAQSPAVTLTTRRGACRDITVLFLAACRSLGMAGRFVSGYQARAQTPDGQRHLHAWAEVFLPGLGWSGWDPTHGVRVTDGHVALCAAPEQTDTMPVEGAFYGPALMATLDCSVRIATA
jgi:transglutaminase-like putative cysteine protease